MLYEGQILALAEIPKASPMSASEGNADIATFGIYGSTPYPAAAKRA